MQPVRNVLIARGEPARFQALLSVFEWSPAFIGPRFEPKTLGLAPARAFGLCCCLVGVGNGLGIFLSLPRQRELLSDSLGGPVRRHRLLTRSARPRQSR